MEPSVLNFKPKNDSEYFAQVREHRQVKSRRHETLVAQFGAWAQQHGLQIGTTGLHPVDALLRNSDQQWIVEAKFVYAGNATGAFREAIGQLIEYHHTYYRNPTIPTNRLAVFSESIGNLYTEILDSEATASIWKSGDGSWTGSPLAISQGLPAVSSFH